MNYLNKNIVQIAKQAAEESGFLLIDVIVRGDERNRIIEIYIDSLPGISTDDCAEMSFKVGTLIDESNLITSKYRLDVSSPGVDRPIIFLEQFPKHVNRKFEITYQNGEEIKKIIGKLVKIEDDNLVFNLNNTETIVNFTKIKSAKVLISF